MFASDAIALQDDPREIQFQQIEFRFKVTPAPLRCRLLSLWSNFWQLNQGDWIP
jgi:hypothetical protein